MFEFEKKTDEKPCKAVLPVSWSIRKSDDGQLKAAFCPLRFQHAGNYHQLLDDVKSESDCRDWVTLMVSLMTKNSSYYQIRRCHKYIDIPGNSYFKLTTENIPEERMEQIHSRWKWLYPRYSAELHVLGEMAERG